MRKSIVLVPLAMTGAVLLMAAAPAEAVKAVPFGNPAEWITSDDYSPPALEAGASGTVSFVLDVDTSGTPRQCSITRSSGFAVLDTGTCSVMMARARFVPQADASGQAVATQYARKVVWSLPSGPNPPPYPVTFDTAAVPVACRVQVGGNGGC